MGILREFALAVVIALLALAAASAMARQEMVSAAGDGEAGIVLGKARSATFGGAPSVIVPCDFSGDPDGWSSRILLSETPFPSKIAWWNGSSTGAATVGKLRGGIEESLKPSGWKISGRGQWSEDGWDHLVVATGAWPEDILESISENSTSLAGRTIIYFGIMDGSSIGKDGKIGKSENWPEEFLGDGTEVEKNAGWKRYKIRSGVEVLVVPFAPDEIMDVYGVAANVSYEMMVAEGAAWKTGDFSISEGRNNFVLKNAPGKNFVRAVFEKRGEIRKLADDGPVVELVGSVEGPEEAGPGPAPFRVSITPNLSQDESLVYYSAVIDENGAKSTPEKIGEGKTRDRWVGAFMQRSWPEKGDAVIQIEDQYLRVFGKAFVRIPKYTVEKAEDFGAEKQFAIKKDGEPIADGYIRAWKTDRNASAILRASDGRVSVRSDWQAGENSVTFDLGGREISFSWQEGGGGTDIYIRFGLPGIALAALVYLALRPGRKTTYRIRTETYGQHSQILRKMSFREFAKLIGKAGEKEKAATLHEILDAVNSDRGAKYMVPEESLRDALLRGVKNRRILEWNGYYALPLWGSSLDLRNRAMKRALNDKLVISGIKAKFGDGAFFEEKGAREWAPYDGGAGIFRGLKGTRTVVFFDEDEIECAKLEWIKDARQNARIGIALHEGKIRLRTIGSAVD